MASMFTTITNIPRFASDAGKSQPLYLLQYQPPILPSRPNLPLTAGLEKTLRLLQGLSQIIIAYTSSPLSATPWLQARKQFALGTPSPPSLLSPFHSTKLNPNHVPPPQAAATSASSNSSPPSPSPLRPSPHVPPPASPPSWTSGNGAA